MRYNINEVVYGVAFITITDKTTTSPMVWDDEFPKKIIVREFTVTEHHKVPNAFDEKQEKICEGFILKDKDGNTWFNQYPHGYYSQTSNSADFIFEYQAEENEDTDELIKNKSSFPTKYRLLTDFLYSLNYGLLTLQKEKDKTSFIQERIKILGKLLEEVIKTFNQEFPLKEIQKYEKSLGKTNVLELFRIIEK